MCAPNSLETFKKNDRNSFLKYNTKTRLQRVEKRKSEPTHCVDKVNDTENYQELQCKRVQEHLQITVQDLH